jgi:hypothetical protein
MAINVGKRSGGSQAYATVPEPLMVPSTPLESRQGLHPKTVSPS